MGSVPLVAVLLALLAWPVRALSAQDLDVVCGGECGCGRPLLCPGAPSREALWGSNEARVRVLLWKSLPAVALGLGQPLHLLASLSGWTWGCRVICGGQAGAPILEYRGDTSHDFFQRTPLPISWL